MQQVAEETRVAFERRLERARVPAPQRPDYQKWVRFYLDFCRKYGHPPRSPTSLGPFLGKLAARHQSVEQRDQAADAIRLLLAGPAVPSVSVAMQAARGPAAIATMAGGQSPPDAPRALAPQAPPMPPVQAGAPAAPPKTSVAGSPGPAPAPPPVVGRGASWEKEYRDLEGSIKLRNYSPKTLAAYRLWVGKFQAFVRSRPPDQLGVDEVRGFLTDLAVRHGVAGSTQNQAFNALLYFFRHVLRREFGQLDGVVRAKQHRYVPVVLSHSETEAILSELEPPYRLVGLLLYGCGLRLAECVNLRVQCFNLDSMLLTVHDGKGQKDRTVPLPARALPQVREQMDFVRRLHAQDLAAGYAGTFLPRQLEKKYKNAA